MLRDLPSKHDGEDPFLSYTLNSTRFAPEIFHTYSFLLATSAANGPVAQPSHACVQVRMYCQVGWLPMRWCIKLSAMPCFRWSSVLSVCTPRRKELEVWLNGWMRGRMSLVTCVKEYCIVSGVTIGFHGSMLYLPSYFLFRPNSPVALQNSTFILHAYRMTYHSISTLSISLFCASGWLSRNILWVTCCFSMQLFEGYLNKTSPRKRFGILLSSRNALDCR
jgi:hypothetical protein